MFAQTGFPGHIFPSGWNISGEEMGMLPFGGGQMWFFEGTAPGRPVVVGFVAKGVDLNVVKGFVLSGASNCSDKGAYLLCEDEEGTLLMIMEKAPYLVLLLCAEESECEDYASQFQASPHGAPSPPSPSQGGQPTPPSPFVEETPGETPAATCCLPAVLLAAVMLWR